MREHATGSGLRPGAFLAGVLVLLLGAAGAWPRAAASEPLDPAQEAGQGVDVAGKRLLVDGAPFLPHGFNMIGVLAPDWCSKGQGPTARDHLGQTEMDAAKAWNANMVRFQVSQRGLADPALDQAQRNAYLERVVAAVDLARSNGFVVDLSVQDQSNGCGYARPLPSAETAAAWDVLAPAFGSNPYVVFELFNEPNQDNTTDGWLQWRDGGATPNANLGEPAVGYQALVDQVRGLGAGNVLIADGLNLAERLSGVPLLTDPLGRLMYGVHPYNFSAGVTWWDKQFGYLTGKVPVIATEWNYTAKRCGTTSESLAPGLLDYLEDHDIGLLAHAFDVPGTTVANWAWAPTGCGTAVGGSGQVTRQYFADLRALEQVPLAAPLNFTAVSRGASQVELGWDAITGLGVTYDVLRDGEVIGRALDPSYVDQAVLPGQTYVYTVRGVRSTGPEGPTAEQVSVTVPDGTDVTPPSTPSTVTASAPTDAAVDLTWQPSSDDLGVTRYVVTRDGVEVGETSETAWSDIAVQPTTTYSYAVAAEDAVGNRSPFSPVTTITTPAHPDTSAPSAPTHLAGRLLSPTSSVLSWTASKDDVGVSGYRILRNGALVATVGASRKPSYTDTSMPSAQTNSYVVSAVDAAGNSSLASSAATVIAPAAAANGLTATYFGTTSLTNPRLTRTDSTIGFSWGTAPPASGIPADKFSVRWTGRVIPVTSQRYTFYTQSDNGMRVWVDGALVVSDWTSHALRERAGSITLKPNQAYTLKVEFYDNAKSATARLLWSTPTVAKQVVPSAQLLAR